MSEPFLIAHLVRGEPAFDIAIRLDQIDEDGDEVWIIPTSGHRAHPYWSDPLQWYVDEMCDVPPPPEGWPDHYPHSASPTPRSAPDLRSLGLAKPKPKIERRI